MPRRAVYRALGGVLAVALGAAAATRSWVALTAVELALVARPCCVVLYDLRAIRSVLSGLPEKAGHGTRAADRAAALPGQPGHRDVRPVQPAGRPFPAELGPLVLRNLIARGDVLEA